MAQTKIPIESFNLVDASARIELVETSGEGNPQRFKSILYSGAIVDKWPWGKLIVDLAGVELPTIAPALSEHDRIIRIGVHDKLTLTERGIETEGYFLGNNDALNVAKDLKSGFPFQMSMIAIPSKVDFVKEGETKKINGQDVPGPCYVFSKSKIIEGTFCVFGADSQTRAIAATSKEYITMDITNVPAKLAEGEVVEKEETENTEEEKPAEAAAEKIKVTCPECKAEFEVEIPEKEDMPEENPKEEEPPAEATMTLTEDMYTRKQAQLIQQDASRDGNEKGVANERARVLAILEAGFEGQEKLILELVSSGATEVDALKQINKSVKDIKQSKLAELAKNAVDTLAIDPKHLEEMSDKREDKNDDLAKFKADPDYVMMMKQAKGNELIALTAWKKYQAGLSKE